MALAETTETIGEHERFDYWRDVICRRYVHIEAQPLPSDGTFQAELVAADIGPVTFSRVWAEPHRVRRSNALIESRPHETFMVSLMLRGNGVLAQDGREAVLGTGDAALYDGSRPFNLALPNRFDMIVLQFAREALLQRCPVAGQLTASRLPGDAPVVTPVSSMLRAIQPAAVREDTTVARQVGASILDILAVTLAEQLGTVAAPGAQRTKYFLRACNYINTHVDEASLDPPRIASAIGVSVRYLHVLFQENGMTVSKFVFRRRLARCHADLLDATRAHMSITDIAHAHGFKSSAHFARKFADAYGETPSSVRAGARRRD